MGGRRGGGALRAKMHQTHAVRHRQYTFEEKSRRSFCPDRGGDKQQKKTVCGIERAKNEQSTCKRNKKKTIM